MALEPFCDSLVQCTWDEPRQPDSVPGGRLWVPFAAVRRLSAFGSFSLSDASQRDKSRASGRAKRRNIRSRLVNPPSVVLCANDTPFPRRGSGLWEALESGGVGKPSPIYTGTAAIYQPIAHRTV